MLKISRALTSVTRNHRLYTVSAWIQGLKQTGSVRIRSNPLGAMLRSTLKSFAKRDDIWGPYKKLPNVRSFAIELKGLDTLLLKFGITKRVDKATVKYTPYSNGKLNRYFEHQLRRMEGATPAKYWRIANYMMAKSNVF